jgi:hypothetical protein
VIDRSGKPWRPLCGRFSPEAVIDQTYLPHPSPSSSTPLTRSLVRPWLFCHQRAAPLEHPPRPRPRHPFPPEPQNPHALPNPNYAQWDPLTIFKDVYTVTHYISTLQPRCLEMGPQPASQPRGDAGGLVQHRSRKPSCSGKGWNKGCWTCVPSNRQDNHEDFLWTEAYRIERKRQPVVCHSSNHSTLNPLYRRLDFKTRTTTKKYLRFQRKNMKVRVRKA